ncbi:dual specificity phosphatase, catalytic domain protein [Dictyocaulus viviparus]|uniref:Dual specificity phosphatase, catalytic domain protein n=1 Tax=Dictyocaulus viviparus TaxID=29172 RepID=A0A0D8XPR1_DICVI|nr:dual specificity phosphatase, catalytic domain protein [Dictyocaulus viviparus]
MGSNRRFNVIECVEYNVDDNNAANISKYFENACEFIDAAREKGGKTIIFCAAGISRSATLAIMYLVIKRGMSLRDAYYHVNQTRPIISPNIGFWRQMIEFEKHMFGKTTVSLITRRFGRPFPDVYLH